MNAKALAAIALTLIVVGPLAVGYLTAVGNEDIEGWETVDSKNVSDLLLNHNTDYTATYLGVSNNTMLALDYNGATIISPEFVTKGQEYSVYPYTSATAVTLTPTNNSINMPLGFSWTFANSSLSFIIDGSGYSKAWSSSGYTFAYNHETRVFSAGTESYNVTDYLTISRSTALTVYRTEVTGEYGQIADGWTLPANSMFWMNEQDNESVTFAVNLKPGASVSMGYWAKAQVNNNGGTVSVTDMGGLTQALGPYENMLITCTKYQVSIEALSAWPIMNSSPQTYNTINVGMPAGGVVPSPANNVLGISSSSAVKPILRCESSEIVAGSFPSTKDYTLDLAALFPGKTLNLRIPSIGVYGDSLTIGGTVYPVENGRIVVDGKPVPLKGAVFAFFPEDGNIVASINGRDLGTFATTPLIVFDGEWSLTATALIMQQTTHTKMTWHAGEFGLDRTGVAAAGLIFAGLAFVGLGMYGKRSGVKVGILLLVCGGAAIGFLIYL